MPTYDIQTQCRGGRQVVKNMTKIDDMFYGQRFKLISSLKYHWERKPTEP